jgi:hypothetical protein
LAPGYVAIMTEWIRLGRKADRMIRSGERQDHSHIPFGSFLVRHHHISAGQLQAALLYQAEHSPRLGALASRYSLLTFDKIREIYEYQLETGDPFGKAAIALGLLSDRELADLLERQSMEHRRIGEILVDLKALDDERLTTLLKEYFESVSHRLGPIGVSPQ